MEKYNIYLNKDKTTNYKIKIIDINLEEDYITFQILNETPITITDDIEDLGENKYKCSRNEFNNLFGIKEQVSISVKKKKKE